MLVICVGFWFAQSSAFFSDSPFLGRCDDVCKNSDTSVPLSESRDAAEEVQGKMLMCFALN